jgi:hypothetical protein
VLSPVLREREREREKDREERETVYFNAFSDLLPTPH